MVLVLLFLNIRELMKGMGLVPLVKCHYHPIVTLKVSKKLVKAVHDHGAKFFIQIQHPGRQSVPIFPTAWPLLEKMGKIPGFWKMYDKMVEKVAGDGLLEMDPQEMIKSQRFLKPNLAPSKMPQNDPDIALWYVKHRAMTIEEIHRTEQQFIQTAVRAQKAGADGIELHATHGYFLHQFLSPFTNRRTDEYGGSFENRCRIIRNIMEGIKKECGNDFPIIVRISADEFHDRVGHPERGYHLDEGIRIAKEMEKYGASAIDVSVGSTDALFLIVESMRHPIAWRQDLAKAIKDAVSIPVICAGVIRTPAQAEQLLQEGKQDFIGLARPLMADSQWVKKAQEGRENEISRCICCMRCMETCTSTLLTTKTLECSLNPRLLKEVDYPECPSKNGKGRPVVVVGAGPAGLMAARELAVRGFQVTLFEKEDKEGGQINLADKPPYKDRIIWTTQDLRAQAEVAGVTFRFGEEATVEKVKELSPKYVIIATGGHAIHPNIPGAQEDYVCTTTPVLKGEICPEGKNVVIIGSGLTGLDTAELLVHHKNKVTLVDMADTIAPGAVTMTLEEIVPALKKDGVTFLLGHKLDEIKDHTVVLSSKKAGNTTLPADVVVLAVGVKSDNALATELKKATSVPIYTIGDAEKPGRIVHAIHKAFHTVRKLK
uniref:Enoate reductase n=1 Tax=Piromyces sp. TaxID=45796 RepID=A0A2S1TZ22_PIRSP|nr:Enoate reductase [Piromyces sp.]